MNQTRYCQVQGHQENNSAYLCTYNNCKLDSKWVCVDCMFQENHKHGQPNQNHLMKQQQFLDFIKQQSKTMLIQKTEDKKLIQISIKELQNLIQSTQFLIQRLQEDLDAIEKNYHLDEIEEILNITKDNYFLLENKQIEKILNINNHNKNFQYNLSQDVLKQLIKIDRDLQKFLKNNFKKQKFCIKQQIILDNQIIQPNAQLVYQRYFEYDVVSPIITSQISYDEKYLVFGGVDRKIQVYDIFTKKLIQSILIYNLVNICRFTKDSKYLICGDSEGFLYCFDTNNNFNQQYKNKIHSSQIKDILPIDNNQIISCSFDKSIKITNIKQKTQQLLITNAHNNYINSVDFDQQNDIIISCSNDKSIKFFNKTTGIMQFQNKDAHDNEVVQIQIISDQNNLLSSSCFNIILWQIDYLNNQLKKIKVFEQEHFNFTSVANNNRTILICMNEVQILDQSLSLMQSINHNLNISNFQNTRQIYSMNYILITKVTLDKSKILILKRT